VIFSLENAEDEITIAKKFPFVKLSLSFEELKIPQKNLKIGVIGFGPAGMFAALTLAENGFKPVVFERGCNIDTRKRDVDLFCGGGTFNPESNIQFGEGGAGTFSDGKLTTRINDNFTGFVLHKFAQFGAPPEILNKARPHIGTDNLCEIIKNIRKAIISLGGEVRFNTKITGIENANGGVRLTFDNETENFDRVILAAGHSAKDIFTLLKEQTPMEHKPFSVGVRIEHRRVDINRSLYGENPGLPEGEYMLSKHIGGRGVYTFCMCPGGMVMPSNSEPETVVTNGMSEFGRNGDNSNAAVCVSVNPEDFDNSDLFGGLKFIEIIEKSAYRHDLPYCAPGTSVGGFIDGKPTLDGLSVTGTYPRGLYESDFTGIFPEFVITHLKQGLKAFSNKLSAYGDMNALLTAPETRTSSPLRIKRNENGEAYGIKGLFPCGEGAGYAGGIMSAAVDGLRCAMWATHGCPLSKKENI
jgi:uncharacterized FAD-dependent dehydrogenase